jgi:hypothetical protein
MSERATESERMVLAAEAKRESDGKRRTDSFENSFTDEKVTIQARMVFRCPFDCIKDTVT